MWSPRPQARKHTHGSLSCASLPRRSYWCERVGVGVGVWGRDWTYRAGPSSYDVKAQRAVLTHKDNGHALSFTVLWTDRGETRWSETLGGLGGLGGLPGLLFYLHLTIRQRSLIFTNKVKVKVPRDGSLSSLRRDCRTLHLLTWSRVASLRTCYHGNGDATPVVDRAEGTSLAAASCQRHRERFPRR